MAFNGSGTYVLTAGQPVVAGTDILDSTFNTLTADLATALSTCVTRDGQSPPTTNLPMGSFKLTGLAAGTAAGHSVRFEQLQTGVNKLITVAGTGDVITGVMTPTYGAYTNGDMFTFIVGSTNTTNVTINIDGLGAKAITNGTTALTAGELTANRVVVIQYDGTRFQLLNSYGVTTFAGGTTGLTPAGATSGAVTLAGTLAEANGGTGTTTGYYGFKNRIINGAMVIDQRNAGASQTFTAAAALAYSVDRWYGYCTGANVTGQQIAGTYADSKNRYQFTGAASVTAIGFGQRIEQANSYDLANTTATLSCYISNSLLTTVTWTASYATTTADTFGTLASPTVTQIATGTFTVSGTRTKYTTNITVPSAATTGIQILFTVGAQTSGTWIMDSVQLEKGSTATSFDYRPYGTELALCQRYYFKTFAQGTAPVQGLGSTLGALLVSTSATSTFGGSLPLPVTMRATPTTVTTFNPQLSSANGNWRDTNNGADRTANSSGGGDSALYVGGLTGVVNGLNYIHLTASAEL